MTVREAIRAGRYKNHLPYAFNPVPVDEDKMTVKQAREHRENQKQKNREQRDHYHADNSRLRTLFQADLEEEYGVVNNPKAKRLFEMAWEHGHSSGYEEVLGYYEDLVELILP